MEGVTRYIWFTTDYSLSTIRLVLNLFLITDYSLYTIRLVLRLFLELLFHFPANIFHSLIREQGQFEISELFLF